MVEHTSANAPARDWRLVVLAGGASFAASYALFHYVFPVGRWVAAASAPVASLFLSVIVAFLAMALTLAVLSRMLRTDKPTHAGCDQQHVAGPVHVRWQRTSRRLQSTLHGYV
jgi:hypothetical protein